MPFLSLEDFTRALAEIREHPHGRELAQLTVRVLLGRIAQGKLRRDDDDNSLEQALAEAPLTDEQAQTSWGNVLDLLSRGPATTQETVFVAALLASGFTARLEEEADEQQLRAKVQEALPLLDWLEVNTALSPYQALSATLHPELSAVFWDTIAFSLTMLPHPDPHPAQHLGRAASLFLVPWELRRLITEQQADRLRGLPEGPIKNVMLAALAGDDTTRRPEESPAPPGVDFPEIKQPPADADENDSPQPAETPESESSPPPREASPDEPTAPSAAETPDESPPAESPPPAKETAEARQLDSPCRSPVPSPAAAAPQEERPVVITGQVEGPAWTGLKLFFAAITGVLFFRWLWRIVARHVLRWQHQAQLRLDQHLVTQTQSVQVLGRVVRERVSTHPLATIRACGVERRFRSLHLLVGILGLVVGMALGVNSLVEGTLAQYPPLVLLGLSLIAVGVLFDIILDRVVPMRQRQQFVFFDFDRRDRLRLRCPEGEETASFVSQTAARLNSVLQK